MNRIEIAFSRTRAEKRIAIMPFLVAGYPTLNKSLRLLKLLAQNADLLEIGFPYSDPLADGPVIQSANQQALRAGSTVSRVFELIRKLRKTTEIPITVLVYANLVYQRGIEKFYRDAASAGVDGVLIPDLPFEEMEPFAELAKKAGVLHVCLVSSATSPARIKKVTTVAEGFLYLTSVLGVTGARKDIPQSTLSFLRQVSRKVKLPVAVGFGISNSAQVNKLKINGASGAIIGSHLIKMVQRSGKGSEGDIRRFFKMLSQKSQVYKKAVLR